MMGILLSSDEMRTTIVVLEAAALFDVHLSQISLLATVFHFY
jgi:hypothetical protein